MNKHPELADKLLLLYSLRMNPEVKSHADLATAVGVARQAVSRWCRGTQTSTGNSIPNYQIEKVADVFGIDANWLTLGFEDFEFRARNKADSDREFATNKVVRVSISTMPITDIKIFGRDQELRLLDTCWTSSTTNVLQIVAFGGMGKSSLVNRWLSDMHKDNYRRADAVYAWSFYWQGESSDNKSSGDAFIEHALSWFGDENPTEGTAWSRASRLVDLLRSSNTLLVLDGLEAIQFGPGNKAGQLENPTISILLRELATENPGLCIITSRMPVLEFAPYDDGRTQTLNLSDLSLDTGIELMESRGATGDRATLKAIASKYSGHPLSLSLLGTYILVAHEGNSSRFTELEALPDTNAEAQHTRNVIRQYITWFKDTTSEDLLYLVSLFDRPTSIQTLKTVVQNGRVLGLRNRIQKMLEAQWSFALEELRKAKLVSTKVSEGETVIDCHPLVRRFVTDFLKSENSDLWTSGNYAIFEELQRSAVENPMTLSEMEPLMRAVVHGVRSGSAPEAFELYYKKIKKGQFLIPTEGSHLADRTCLSLFFERKWSKPLSSLPPEAEGYLLLSASANLIHLGDIREAIETTYASIDWFTKNQQWVEVLATNATLISMLIATGELKQSIQVLDGIGSMVDQVENSVVHAMMVTFRAYILFLAGDIDEAGKLFLTAERVFNQASIEEDYELPTVSAYYCKFLLDTGQVEKSIERGHRTQQWREAGSWQVRAYTTSILASDLMVLGLGYLTRGDMEAAKRYLDEQVELFRASNDWLYFPTGLNARSRLHVVTGNFTAAKKDLEESLGVSRRTGARHSEWEAYINLAQLGIAEKVFDSASHYLQLIENFEGMDEFRYRDSDIAELKKQLASELV